MHLQNSNPSLRTNLQDPDLLLGNEKLDRPVLTYDPKEATSSHSTATSSHHVAATAPASVPMPLSLSPDALMAYCQSRLNSLDTQMSTIFQSQETNSATTSSLNAIDNAYDQLPAPNSKTPPMVAVTSDQATTINEAYKQAISQAGQNSQLGESLTKDQTAFNSNLKNGEISSDNISSYTQNLKNDTSTLNSDSEMTMINLQSLMSQRETAVQLTTNLLQSLDNQDSDIAKNIGQ